jgi:hypothetical protein
MGQAADQWWFWRGFQSAVFYYVSCGPCYATAYRRKRRKEGNRDKRQKQQLQMEQPDLYHHPAPFETNPHWQEEINLGPKPPPRRTRNRTRDSNDKRTITTASTMSTVGSHASSSIDLGPQQHTNGPLGGHSWNKKRYHRPDEEFVEADDEEEEDMESKAVARRGSLGGISGWTISKPEATYYSARAPPVNDLHPPVVSTPPSHWKDRSWMKAPPPSAKFMQGKKGVTNLSRTGSKVTIKNEGLTTDVTLAPSPALQPQSGNVKSNTLELPEGTVSRKTSSRLSTRGERIDSVTAQQQSTPTKSSLDAPLRGRRRSRPPPVRIDSSSDESDFSDYSTPISKAKLTAKKSSPRKRKAAKALRASTGTASPPHLAVDDMENISTSTTIIVSPALTARSEHTAETVSPISSPAVRPLSLTTTPQVRPQLLVNDSSLNVLENTAGNLTQSKSLRLSNSKYDKSPFTEAKKLPLPESDSKEVLALQGDVNIEELWLGEQKLSTFGRNKRWSVPDF